MTNATSVKHFVACGVVDPSTSVPDAPSTPAAWWPVRRPNAAPTLCWVLVRVAACTDMSARCERRTHHLSTSTGASRQSQLPACS